jgi:WD40 repeat protein
MSSKTFRIFVSSTFSDLHAERDALQRRVFPRLRELCLQHGCRFQAIDLRWGVSKEAGRDQKTMKICLDEIKRCQRVTPRPNFIVLLGDRYGWCPLPEEIPDGEFEEILKNVSDEERAILVWDKNQPENQKGWYRLDENAKPFVYCLQPREGKFEEYSVWEKVERKLHQILERAVENLDLKEKARAKYVASATEQEINQGLTDEKATEHVFCFFRSFSNRNSINLEKAKGFFELDEAKKPNEVANQKLENLKNRLRDELPKQNVHEYQARWLNENSESKVPLTADHIGDLPKEFQNLPGDLEECKKLLNAESTPQGENLCLDVFRQLARVILAEISEIESRSKVEKEYDEHKKFGSDRAKNFVGRTEYLEKIKDYIESDNQKPFVLWGASGSGKSALLAYAKQQHEEKNPLVRFIGTTPQSSDIRALLESLCEQIAAEYPTEETAIPADYNELVKEFPKRLESAAKEKTLIVLLDALDQLSEADNAHNLRWLPDDLPANVRLIVSTLPGASLDILKRKLPVENIIELKSMTKNEGGEVLDLWLSDATRTLQDNHRAEVLDKFTAAEGLPLYLKFAFEEARLWHSYDKIKPLATDVEGIIGELFERLSEDSNHGAVMVSRSLGYLAASRYGLTEDELIDILWQDDEVKKDFKTRSQKEMREVDALPVVIWARLYFDLEPYLTERASADAALLSFYHRQLGEVTAQKYLAEKDKQRAHQHLADYFDGQNYWLETPAQYLERVGEFPKSARRSNQRKAAEFAWQLQQSGDYERLEQIHTNLDFLESKTAAGLVFELAKDFTEAIKIIPAERPQRRIIRLLEEALRRDIHFIARHREDYPQALFQCLWNSCWWYDCPQAANHYEEKEGPWSREGEKLYQLLEKWWLQIETETPDFKWIQTHRPPLQSLRTGQQVIIHVENEGVSQIIVSSDERKIISSCQMEGKVHIWSLETGECLNCLTYSEGWIQCMAVTSDARKIVIGSGQNIYVGDLEGKEGFQPLNWDIFSNDMAIVPSYFPGIESVGFSFSDFNKDEKLVNSIAIPQGDQKLVVGCSDSTIHILDLETGKDLKCFEGHSQSVEKVIISPDGQKVISLSSDRTARIWDLETGKELRCLKGRGSFLHSIAISPDGKQLISDSKGNTIDIWDIKTGILIRSLHGHNAFIKSLDFSQDGKKIVSGSWDKTVRIWDVKTGKEIWCFKGHSDFVESVKFLTKEQKIISGSEDRTIRFWEIENDKEIPPQLKGHVVRDLDINRMIKIGAVLKRSSITGDINSIAISPDGKRAVSVSEESIMIWQIKGEVKCIRLAGWNKKNPLDYIGGLTHIVQFSSDGREIFWATNHDLCIINLKAWLIENYVDYDSSNFPIWILGEDEGKILDISNWEKNIENELSFNCFLHSEIRSFTISSKGNEIWYGTDEGLICIFHQNLEKNEVFVEGHDGSVNGLAVTKDGKRIASIGSIDRKVQIWNIETKTKLESWEGGGFQPQNVAFSSNGEKIAVGWKGIINENQNIQNMGIKEISNEQETKIISGLTDPQSLADEENYPLRAFNRGLETIIENDSGFIAAFPIALDCIKSHPSGKKWLGGDKNHLTIIEINGVEIKNSYTESKKEIDLSLRESTKQLVYNMIGEILERRWSLEFDLDLESNEDNNLEYFESDEEYEQEYFETNEIEPQTKIIPSQKWDQGTIEYKKEEKFTENKELFNIPHPHPKADPTEASKLNFEYQKSLKEWNNLSWWKKLWTKKPEPPKGI